jgi:site-specific recombinase XerD
MDELLEYFSEYLIIKGYSKNTTQALVTTVGRFKKWADKEGLEESEISYNDVLAYMKALQRDGVKQRTVQLYINALKHYFRFLQSEAEIIAESPAEHVAVKGIKRRHLYDLFTEEELSEIYSQYQVKGAVGRRNKIILGLMLYQGLRTEELAALTPGDLKLREGKIYVSSNRRANTRNMELRSFQIIDLQDYLYKIRPLILEMMDKQSQKLFVSMGSSDRFSNMMQKLMKTLKKQNPRIKAARQIRASVITNWLKRYNLRKVQYMAGHRYVSSTEMYQIGNLEDLQSDIAKFHPVG